MTVTTNGSAHNAADKVDFIVVGSGPAGCAVAWRLANTPSKPSVLLLEAGHENKDPNSRIDADRYIHHQIPSATGGYQTVPQPQLDNKSLMLARGKGLGGSSNVNFSAWAVGSAEDYNAVAERIDDEEWKWPQVQERLKRIENYHPSTNLNGYSNARSKDHGKAGPLDIDYAQVVEKSFSTLFDAAVDFGIPLNPDPNSGNPVGMGACANTAYQGKRVTAADLLRERPTNLTVITNTHTTRVLFNDTRATGVELLDGTTYHSSNEVILSCGTLDTPKVLMHSGIGPTEVLSHFNIPIIHLNPNVGRHPIDHNHILMTFARNDSTSDRPAYYRSTTVQTAAHEQWTKDQTGPLAEYGTTLAMAFPKLPQMLDTPEFHALPPATQYFLQRPTVPHYEFVLNALCIQHLLDPANAQALASIFCILQNPQSRGTVTLGSADPAEPALFDTKTLTHPYDRRLAIEMTREVLRMVASPGFAKDTLGPVLVPEGDSDEEILAFWRRDVETTWNMTGTCRMGRTEEEAVVDKEFRVFGTEGLRCADMSVLPVLVNGHTQACAYVAGLTLGDKLVKEYELE